MSGKLRLHVSNRVQNSLSKAVKSRLLQRLKEINKIGLSLPGRDYNISLSEAYIIANGRRIKGAKRDLDEILEELDFSLHGPGPTWIKEHVNFKNEIFDKVILPHAFVFTQYLKQVDALLDLLEQKDYYMSFQAVYYGIATGYVNLR